MPLPRECLAGAAAAHRADVGVSADHRDAFLAGERKDAALVLQQHDALAADFHYGLVVRRHVGLRSGTGPLVDATYIDRAQRPAHHVGEALLRELALLVGLAQR